MAKEIAALLADVQRLMREVSEMNANDNANQVKEESQPEASETNAPEPAPSPASDLVSKDDGQPEGLVIGAGTDRGDTGTGWARAGYDFREEGVTIKAS